MTEVRLIDGDLTVSDVSALLDRLIAATGEESSEYADIVELVKDAVLKKIGDQPTIEAEPVRHGRWIEPDSETIGKYRDDGCVAYYSCSCCKEISKTDYDFCPNCGAIMDGGADTGGWILTKDQLPDKPSRYLAYAERTIYCNYNEIDDEKYRTNVLYFDGKEWTDIESICYDVIRWMPIPKYRTS